MKKSAPTPTRRSTRSVKPVEISKVNLDHSRTRSLKPVKTAATKEKLEKAGK